ncbi:MAG: hypothetical protein R3F13_13940 [Prosthecobacter sp.]
MNSFEGIDCGKLRMSENTHKIEMKSSPVTPLTNDDTAFFTAQSLLTPAALVTTIAGFVIAVAKKVEGAIKAIIVDRALNDPGGLGKIFILPATNATAIEYFEDGESMGSAEPDFTMVGTKTGSGSLLQWGVNEISALDVDTAVSTALAALNIEEETGIDHEGLNAAISAIVAPDYGSLSPRTGLDKILDVAVELRKIAVDQTPRGVIMEVLQGADEVTVNFYVATEAAMLNFAVDTFAAEEDLIVSASSRMPEDAIVAASTPKLALE